MTDRLDLVALGVLVVVLGLLVVGLSWLVSDYLERLRFRERSELQQVEAEASQLRRRLNAWLRRQQLGLRLDEQISRAGIGMLTVDLLGLYVGAALLGFLLANSLLPVWLAPVGAYLGFLGVRVWLQGKRKERLEEFVNQLPELARTLSNATSAGRSLLTALHLAAVDLDDPAGTELGLVSEQLRIGASVDEALERLRERLPSRELGVLVSTLVIQQRSGGDVVHALRDMAETLESRKDVRREVQTVVSGAVQTGYVTGGLGLGLVLLVNQMQDGMIEEMAGQPIGLAALAVAGTLYVVAFVASRRMTNIDV